MNKIAQRRDIWNKTREKLNDPGEAVTGMFSPEFTRLMDRLREVDDEAREHAIDLKDMLKVAKSNFNRREYMTAITFLGRFHERIELVKQQFLHLIKETDMIHNEFLFGDLDSEHKNYLTQNMTDRFKAKSKIPAAKPEIKTDVKSNVKADDGTVKNAGPRVDKIKDWWHNLTDDRGKSLKNWEKKFPKKAKDFKRSTEKMLSRSEMFQQYLLTTFKALATARATRDLEGYLKISQGFIQKYDAYDAAFNEYFNANVRSYIESQKEFDRIKKERDEFTKQITNRPEDGAQKGELPGDLPPDSEAEVPTNRVPPKGPDGGGGKEKTIDEVLQDLEQGKNPSEPTPEDAVLRQLMNGPARSEQEKLEVLRDPLGEEPSSVPRDFPKPDLYEPDTIKGPAPDPNSFLGMLPSNTSTPVSSGPASVTPVPPSGNRTVAPMGISPRPLDSSIQELSNSPTMRSPIMPPPASPMPSSNIYEQPIPTAPRTPIIDESPHSSSRYHMYPPPPVAPPPDAVPTIAPPNKGPMSAPATEPRPHHIPTLVYKPLSKAEEFLDRLTKLSNGNPLVMATEIIKFAKTIEQTDKTTSDRLLVVARNLLK